MPSLKLYYHPVSQPSRAVAWLINTHALPVEYVLVDLMKHENFSEEFTSKNPFQAVPVLELEDGQFLNESGAILIYLTKKFGINGEIPSTLEAESLMWAAMFGHSDLCRRVTMDLLRPAFAKLHHPALTWDEVRATIAKNEPQLLWSFGILEKKLGKHTYIAGDEWTLADYNVAAELSQWRSIDGMLPDTLKSAQFPNMLRYVNTVSQRKGYAEFVAAFDATIVTFQLPATE